MGTEKVEKLLALYGELRVRIDSTRAQCAAEEALLVAAMPPFLRAAWDRVQDVRHTLLKEQETQLAQVVAKIKGIVGLRGETVAHGCWQAVYSQGRVSWNDDFLQGYAATHPEIVPARSVGQPSVSLRAAKEQA